MDSRRITASQATDVPAKAPVRPLPPTPVPAGDKASFPGRLPERSKLALHGPAGARRRGALLRRLLGLVDWIALVFALAVATTAEIDGPIFLWALIFSPTWILVIKLHGLYDHDHRRIRHSTLDEVPALVSAVALGMLALDGLLAISPAGPMGASAAILTAAVALPTSLILRASVRVAWHNLTGMANGIVIGSPAVAETIARRLAIHPETRLQVVGYLGPDANGSALDGLPRLGDVPDIAAIAQAHQVERVVVAEDEMSDMQAERMIRDCKAAGLALTLLPRHSTLLGPGVELNRLAELPVLDFRFSDPPRSTMMLKRAMDVVVAGLLLLLLSPLFLVISLLIVFDSGLPVLFRQARAGKAGKPFTMLKFRTMVSDAERRLVDLDRLDEPAFKIPNDPRVTRVGRLLRRFSIDELPQLLNVLRGEMNLIGPRPHPCLLYTSPSPRDS